jgi:pimeloyl-ACP methyl ester carboxylesterase
LLQAIAGLAEEQIAEILAELQAAEFLYETRMVPEAEFAFKHTLTHGVTYGSVLRERRRAIHADVVRTIERRHHNQLGEQVERLARHALAGELWDKTIDYCLKAAEMAKSRYAYSIAAEFASTACRVAERESGPDTQRISALVLCGDVNSRLGHLNAANEDYNSAIALEKTPALRQAIENKRHRTGIATRDGSRIAYYQHGRGDVALLFVNPIVYGLDVFQPILERLCQEFHIITLDPRGTGSSDPLHRPYRLRDHAEDVRAVIKASGVRSIVGVGISRGSNLLVRLAHTHPELVDQLVFVGGLADLGTATSPAPRTDYLATASRLIGDDDLEGLVRYHVARIFSEPDTQDLAEGTIRRLLKLPKETLLSFYDEDPDMDIRPMLADLHVPTLVTHGTNDLQVPFAAAQYLATHIPDAELYAFHDAGHLPLFTATEHFCRVLRRFVGAAPGSGEDGPGT